MKALPTSSVPGVDGKLHWITGISVSRYRGAVEPSTASMLLGSLKVLEAAFGTGKMSNILRRTEDKRDDGSLTVEKNVDQDMFYLSKEILACSSSGRDR